MEQPPASTEWEGLAFWAKAAPQAAHARSQLGPSARLDWGLRQPSSRRASPPLGIQRGQFTPTDRQLHCRDGCSEPVWAARNAEYGHRVLGGSGSRVACRATARQKEHSPQLTHAKGRCSQSLARNPQSNLALGSLTCRPPSARHPVNVAAVP